MTQPPFTNTAPPPSSLTPDPTKILQSLLHVAQKAGSMIRTATAPAQSALDTKKNSADLVTETDKAVETLISRTLLAEYPSFDFMGEETYVPGTPLGPGPTFIVDPIDGTTNFVHGWPYVAVSLGYAANRTPTVGVVFNPFSGVCYSAVRGGGAYKEMWEFDAQSETWIVKEGEKIQLPLNGMPKPLVGLDGALVAVEWGSDRSGSNWRTKVDTWDRLGRAKEEGGAIIHSARCLGSAALNLCAVAEGSVDVYWEGGCWAWDVCAGWTVLREAGGMIVDGNPPEDGSGKEGWEIPITHRKYLAVRGAEEGMERQRELIREFWGMVEGRMVYEH